jgi:N-acetylmuramoyl-L-alanine amidase
MSDKIFIIDSGHGGMLGGKYMTDPKMGKFFKHQNGETAYEGVTNRLIKRQVIELLTSSGHKTFDSCPTELDLPLSERCDIINSICRVYGDENCVLISLHSNSGGGTGFEVWTSPGQNKSDEYATVFHNMFVEQLPDIKTRVDKADGDIDKESKFYILMNTRCPAILPEFLFFDNYEDWKLLRNPAVQKSYAVVVLRFANILNFNK